MPSVHTAPSATTPLERIRIPGNTILPGMDRGRSLIEKRLQDEIFRCAIERTEADDDDYEGLIRVSREDVVRAVRLLFGLSPAEQIYLEAFDAH